MEGSSSKLLANLPCPEPEVEVARASGTNKEPDGGDEDNEDGGNSNEDENLLDYPFDGPNNPEEALIPQVAKMKSLKSRKGSHHSKYEEIEASVAKISVH